MSTHYRSLGFAAMAALGLALLSAEAWAAPVVDDAAPADATLEATVLYQNFGNTGMGNPREVRIGNASLSVEQTGDLTWNSGSSTLSINYSAPGTLSTTITGATPSPATFSKTGVPLDPPTNYIQITVAKNTGSTDVSLNNVSINGELLPEPNNDFVGINGTKIWHVTNLNLDAPFTIEGTLVLQGISGGVGSNKVQIDIGYYDEDEEEPTPPDTTGPAVTSLILDPHPVFLYGEVTISATIDDTGKGDSNIASAEYIVDGPHDPTQDLSSLPAPSFTNSDAMTPVGDSPAGQFDAIVEDVEATFTADEVGTYRVCVRGTDSASNVGDAVCQYLTVNYDFYGFFSPVNNYDPERVSNSAKAGQAVPLKWQLLDADGLPIGTEEDILDESHGGGVKSSASCPTFAPSTTDAVEEYAGGSGLQYVGDGYWQYNWKTPKTYANTCRFLYIVFKGGQTSPVAMFQFKK